MLHITQMLEYIDENEDDLKELFAKFDYKGSGSIPTSQLATLMRAYGCNPTEDDVQGV